MAKDTLDRACPRCRKRLWWLTFWRWLTHCRMCHDERWVAQYEIEWVNNPRNPSRLSCHVCTPRTNRPRPA